MLTSWNPLFQALIDDKQVSEKLERKKECCVWHNLKIVKESPVKYLVKNFFKSSLMKSYNVTPINIHESKSWKKNADSNQEEDARMNLPNSD